jgi:gliding motility-associated-like protein
VTVNPTPVIPNQTTAICSGETFVISPTNSLPNTIIPSGTTYQWTVESNPSVTGQSNESSPQTQISQRLFNMTNAVQIVTYNVTPTSGADGFCIGDPFEVTVQVNPVPVIADVVVPAICSGTDFEVIPVNGSGSNSDDIVPSDMTYTWTVVDLSGQISGDSDESAAQNSISQTLTNDSNIPQTVTYTVIPTYDVAAANCQAAPFQVEVTVNPEPTMDAVASQSICGGTAFDALSYISDVSGVSYAWELTSTTIPTDITGYPFPSGTGELSPVVIQNDGDTPFTLNYELTVLYGGCEGNTVPFSITINPSPLVTISSSASQSICFGGTANFNTLTASYTYPEPITNVSYQWYYNTADSTETTNAIPVGTDNQDYTPASNTIGTRYYFSVLSFNPNVCNDVASNTVEIVVNDPVIITVDPEPTQTICVGGEISGMSVAYSGGAGNPEYQWFEGTFPSGAPIPNSNFPDLELDPDYFSTVGTFDFYATISFPASSGCLSVNSASGSVIVVDDPVLTAPLATQSICQGSIPDLTVTASPSTSPTGVYTYQWYDALTNQPVVGATSDTFTLTMPSVGTFNYYAVVTTSTSGCETQSAPAEIIVEPAPSISTQPLAEQNLCQLETITDLEVLYANGIGTPTYQWYQSTTCDTTDLSTPVGTDAPIFSPPANIGAFYYFVELSFSEGGCGSIFSECSKVEITPLAFIPDLDPVVEIPDETSFIFSPQDGSVPDLSTIVPAGTTYTWTFVPNPNISGANSFSEIDFPNGTGAPNAFDSGVLNNINPTFTQLETIVFQVTPWTNGCNGTPFDITIKVAAAPEINEVITNQPCYYQDQLCEASIEISPVGFGPFTYNWMYLTDPSLPLPNPTDRDQFDLCSGFYQLTITDALNYSYQYEFEVVLPDPLLFNLVALTEISCNNTNTFPCDGSIEVSTSGGELPYSLVEWYTETIPDSGVFDSGPFVNNINPNELLNVCEGNYVLKILDANGCEYVSDIYTIAEAVDPIIITETLSDYNGFNIHCNAANSGTITIDLSGGSGVFDYTFVADATGTVLETDTIFNPPATLVFSALTAGDYTFTIEDPNCTDQIVRNFTLTQPNELIITATLVDAIDCFGGLATYDVIATGGVPPYTGTGLQNVPSGPVTFIVSDANDGFGGCQDDFSTIVFEPVELLATHNFNDALCFGDTGQITVTPTGGTGILTVNLYDNSNTFITSINTTQGSSVTFDQLAGTYFYDVVDQNNCPPYGPQVIVIDEPNPIDVIVTRADDPNCASSPEWEFNNGSICITITGGTNPYPEPSFDLNGSPLNWVDNGGGEWCLNNLSLSPVDLDWEYPIVVTDDNGCLPAIPTVDVPLTRPSEISASFTYDPQIFDCPSNTVSQSVSVSISGGVPPYIVNWQGPEVNLDLTNQFVMTATASGNYMALVNDQHGIANGCPPIEFPLDPITFYEFANAEFNYESGNNDFCGLFSISDPISFNIVSTGDIVNTEWDFGDGSSTVSNVESPTHVYDEIGTYIITLTVTDPYGCIDSYTYPIEITKGYEIFLPTAFTPNADGINDNIRPVYNCMTQVEMIIYDTWGSLLYTETGENIIGWDGTIEGSPAENGNYIMVVRAQAFNGVVVDLNGPITLLK